MIVPELKSLLSVDLERPVVPVDPEDCSVFLQASIGPKGEEGAEVFAFSVVTPAFLARAPLPRWGHGLLLVQVFSWQDIDRSLERLLSHAHRNTWPEVAAVLNQQMGWEFENYQARTK